MFPGGWTVGGNEIKATQPNLALAWPGLSLAILVSIGLVVPEIAGWVPREISKLCSPLVSQTNNYFLHAIDT